MPGGHLPASAHEFSETTYWDQFFKERTSGFEWYGEYDELRPFLHKYISSKDRILIVGCGNSALSHHLYNAGYQSQLNVDISSVVIRKMKREYPHLEFRQDDVTNLNSSDGEFSCILDKGTFDALTPPPSNNSEHCAETYKQPLKMLGEIKRVLKPNGRFICISLLQSFVAKILLQYFNTLGWMIRVCRCDEVEKNKQTKKFTFPVYVCIFTKLCLPGGQSVIEFIGLRNQSSKSARLDSIEALYASIRLEWEFQIMAYKYQHIGSFKRPGGFKLTLYDPEENPMFILYVLDTPKPKHKQGKRNFNKELGIFIVPEGRETTYIFGSENGRELLAKQIGVVRLLIVHLIRDRQYPALEIVKQQIRDSIQFLIPADIPPGVQFDIMTEDIHLGSREIIHRGTSDFSGDYVVEDVLEGDPSYSTRKLIFLNAPTVVQSEAILKIDGDQKTPKMNQLACDHHGVMLISFTMVSEFFKVQTRDLRVCLIGLGGGLLASFIRHYFPQVKLTAVELDSEMVEIGHKFFGLPAIDEGFDIVVGDGLEFIRNTNSVFDIILIDADNKSSSEGLSCPPPSFLSHESLEAFRTALSSNGIFVLNYVCRDLDLKETHKLDLLSYFKFSYEFDLIDEVNTIYFGFGKIPPGNSRHFTRLIETSVRSFGSILDGNAEANVSSEGTTTGTSNSIKALGLDDERIREYCARFKCLRCKS